MIARRMGPASFATALALAVALATVAPAAATTSVARVFDAEKYALKLLNCTRTGGWVRADGSCKGRASGRYSAYRRPLPRHSGISTKVAWPWARAMVNHEVCDHYIAGRPTLRKRFTMNGFWYYYYGENVGCGWGGAPPRQVILATHRSMQAEKSYNGGHWKNIKNVGYKSVGIGVATRDGVTMVVYDFYGKRW